MYLLSYNGEFQDWYKKTIIIRETTLIWLNTFFKFSVEQKYETDSPSTELISSFLLTL